MNDINFEIKAAPDYGFLIISLPKDRTIKVEAGSMAAMDTNISMKTKLSGGLSRFLTKESLFINEFTAKEGEGEISIAPATSGDIKHYCLNDETIYLQGSSFLASDTSIKFETKFQGFAKGFFSGESLFLIKCSGTGDLWFNTFGAVLEVDIRDEYIVDTGHIVGFTSGLDYQISRIGGYKSLFFSGEGFVCRFKGQGKVWIQTKNPSGLISWADQYRIIDQSTNNN